MPTAGSITRRSVPSGYSGLYLQGYDPHASGSTYQPDPELELTKDGWITHRAGLYAASNFYASPPVYGQAHPVFTGMGLISLRARVRANGQLIDTSEVYLAGTYGDTIGEAQQPSDEFTTHGTSEEAPIQEHESFFGSTGSDAPWAQYWDFTNQRFYNSLDTPPAGYSVAPDYLQGITTFTAGKTLVTATQYFNSLPSNQYDLVGELVDVPILSVWGSLPGDATTIDFGGSGQWLCVDFEIGLRGQWWYRKTGHLYSAINAFTGEAWPTEIYNSGSL
jgi:hypothetical protein